MRVLVIGQKAFGADVLLALLEKKVNIVGVIIGTDDISLVDPIEEVANLNKISIIKTTDLKEENVEQFIIKCNPDLMVMAFVTLYMPQSLIDIAPMGAINFHPSLLPAHRGISALPWTILSGDKVAGLTIYHVDSGIDTGDIIIQKSVPIDDNDDLKTLYFKKIFPLGVEAVCEAVTMLEEDNAPRIKQTEEGASYEPPLKKEYLKINWDESLEIHRRKIRAGNPGMGAISELRKQQVHIYGSQRTEGKPLADVKAGTIIKIDSEGIYVNCIDGILKLTVLCFEGSKKAAAHNFAIENSIKVNEVFN